MGVGDELFSPPPSAADIADIDADIDADIGDVRHQLVLRINVGGRSVKVTPVDGVCVAAVIVVGQTTSTTADTVLVALDRTVGLLCQGHFALSTKPPRQHVVHDTNIQ